MKSDKEYRPLIEEKSNDIESNNTELNYPQNGNSILSSRNFLQPPKGAKVFGSYPSSDLMPEVNIDPLPVISEPDEFNTFQNFKKNTYITLLLIFLNLIFSIYWAFLPPRWVAFMGITVVIGLYGLWNFLRAILLVYIFTQVIDFILQVIVILAYNNQPTSLLILAIVFLILKIGIIVAIFRYHNLITAEVLRIWKRYSNNENIH